MLNFDRSGITRKLTLICVLSTGSALLLVLLAFAATALQSHRKNQICQLQALARVIGANSAAAVQRGDRAQAGRTLQTLEGVDGITQAALYDGAGHLLAHYGAAAPPDSAALAPLEADAAPPVQSMGPPWARQLRLLRPLVQRRQVVGAVLLDADLNETWAGIAAPLVAVGAAIALSLLIALFLAARLRRAIAAPISELIDAARQVSSSQTYHHRISHQRNDELGTLIDSFNHMLAQIDSRDAALMQYRDQLEGQVGVRTAQLEKAKNAAEAASQAKSAFLATMSHEIRTPMNGVLGMTEMLLASALTEQQRHYTSMVKRSGEHLLVIINDILDFSKIEAGKLTVEYIHFNFRELLDDLDHVFTPQARAKGLALDFDIACDIPVAVCGDPNRLRQVIVNLLGNAVKFTEAGQIAVKVRVSDEDSQSVGLRIEVHDTGIGISADAQARIFDSFSQADGSTTRKHGGTGLGLAISKQLVELMGGRIGVDNARVQGSVFWFTVRFDKQRVDPGVQSPGYKASAGLRALVVDENTASRDALEHQLSAWRIAVSGATAATEALQLLREAVRRGQPYDVALLDMTLTRTSGLALAATIKAEPAIAGVRLILLSSERGAADTLQRREAGVAFQLIKPARESDLFDCIVTPQRASEGMRLAAPSGVPSGEPDGRAPGARKRCKVLLAEDNPVNVEVAMAMLDGLGLEVACAGNGEEALRAARAEPFDLVLMDCQMPVMDGFAATAEIRRDELQRGRTRMLPIIAITANALQGDREACLAAGMDDYLSKPFTQQTLGQAIARWITLPRAAAVHHGEAGATAPAPAAAPHSAAPAAAKDVINRRALDNIRALSASGGEALLQRVIHAFVDDTPQQFQTLRLAIAALNPNSIRKAAHSLKSSSANVGADALAQMCREMERLGRSDTTEGASGILIDMEQEFQVVRDSLSSILEKEI